MNRRWMRLLAVFAALGLLAAACGSDDDVASEETSTTAAPADDAATTTPDAEPDEAEPEEAEPEEAEPEGTPVAVPGYSAWEDVLADADGATVNFYMWGGSDTLNGWVDEYLGGALKDQYNVELKPRPYR